jgi:hypothetical protein
MCIIVYRNDSKFTCLELFLQHMTDQILYFRTIKDNYEDNHNASGLFHS